MSSSAVISDIAARRPVWEALSTLFLDTDVSLLLPYRAKKLAASPYTIEELERILCDEVSPVCSWNLLSVAGEWAGFDEEWLEKRIVSHLNRRFHPLRGIASWLLLRDGKWRRTREAVLSLRLSALGHPTTDNPTTPPTASPPRRPE